MHRDFSSDGLPPESSKEIPADTGNLLGAPNHASEKRAMF